MMGLRNMLSARLIAGLLFFGAACIGSADHSHAAMINFIGAGEADLSAMPPPASTNRVVDEPPVFSNETPGFASASNSAPELQIGGLSAITRTILHMSSCVCSGLRQLFANSSPVSTKSTAPTLSAPAVPGAMLLFMTGLVTVIGVARRPQGRSIPTAASFVQIEAPHIPLPGYLLIISNDTRFAKDLAARFARYGYMAESVPDTVEAASMAARQAPALVLVDRRRSGWQMLRQSAPFQSVPMMTVVPAGLGWVEDACVDDLDHGMDSTHVCDDSSRLLVAKVSALLRRSAWLTKEPAIVRAGQVELDVDRCEVRVAGQANHLPPVQFKLLKRLMESPGTVFRRQELLDHIWGEGYAVETHTLDVHIFWLRRLLEHDQTRSQTIATVRGVGIKFVVDRLSGESTRICSAWPGKTSIRRSRTTPQRRTNRRLRIVKPIAVRTAV